MAPQNIEIQYAIKLKVITVSIERDISLGLQIHMSSYEHKKPFYHKRYFLWKMNVRHSMGVLHSFSIKNIFYYKIDLRLFYFHVAMCRGNFSHDDENDKSFLRNG